MPPFYSRPKNLGISHRTAVMIAGIGAMVSASVICMTVIIYGVDERTTPVILPLLGALAMVVTNLVSALKSSEAADTAAKARNLAELTASQTSAMHQSVLAHCGEICTAVDCPMRIQT